MTPRKTFSLSPHKKVEIEIHGAVKKPGVYSVWPGTLLKGAVKKSSPLPSADLASLDLTQRVEGPLSLEIPEKKSKRGRS